MNEEKLNISVRKFLKNVGINSQRHIESRVRESLNSGKISSNKKISVTAKIESDELGLSETISGEIEIELN